MKIPIACDTGGTFTDFIFKIGEEFSVFKIPSTPSNPAKAVLDGLARIGKGSHTDRDLIHGMTIGINYLLERKGSQTLLITTKGFKDVIEIGRQNRLHLYKPATKPRELVPRHLRLEAEERIGPDGGIIHSLNEKILLEDLREVKKKYQIQSIAICLLFSFLNTIHEKKVKAIATEIFPNIPVVVSYEILPIFREYERTITTVIDAYISPIVFNYIKNLESAKKFVYNINFIQSNGGICSIDNLQASQSLLSGLTGGVLAAKYSGEVCEEKNLISLDIGGTSTDVSLLENLEIQITSTSKLEDDLPLALPVVDVKTVGAGGGSIAYYDTLNLLQVGPQSQGADPGPACYGKGGNKVCMTDVDLVLGWLHAENFAGGSLKLFREKSLEVLMQLAKNQGVKDLDELSEAIQKIFHFNVASAIRSVSVEKGYDPREFTLVSFGGAGPTHCCAIADILEIKKIIIPPFPGVWSAFGLLTADYRYDYSISIVKDYSFCQDNHAFLENHFIELEKKGREKLQKSGLSTSEIKIQRYADMRYKGQSFELRYLYQNPGELVPDRSMFDKLHDQKYGYNLPNDELELVNVGVITIGITETIQDTFQQTENVETMEKQKNRKLYYNGKWIEVPILLKSQLRGQEELVGPLVIEQSDSTIILLPDWNCKVLPTNHLLLTKKM